MPWGMASEVAERGKRAIAAVKHRLVPIVLWQDFHNRGVVAMWRDLRMPRRRHRNPLSYLYLRCWHVRVPPAQVLHVPYGDLIRDGCAATLADRKKFLSTVG